MMSARVCGLCWIVALGCHRADPPAVPAPADRQPCFETHGQASATSTAVFARRDLQGGGPTWAAVLHVLVRRHGTVGAPWTKASPVGFGAAYDVAYAGAATWYALDDEAEGAVFCAGSPALLRDVSSEFAKVNADGALLEQALDQADPSELE
jgi:hypothetical protein